MPINSKQQLVDYCLRKLGAPVLQINVDDEQLSDRVDEAIQYWQEYHSDATVPVFVEYTVTSADITNKYIPIPDNIVSIERIFPFYETGTGTDGLFDWQYQLFLNDEFLLRGGNTATNVAGNLAYYSQTMQFVQMMRDMFGTNKSPQITFNRHINRVYIHTNWTNIKEGSKVIFDAQAIVDPEVYTDVYNDHYLKLYLTQLIKLQWAQNMSKFMNMTLPGGAQLDAQRMMDEANADIEKLKEEMRLTWELPVNFYIG